MTAVQAPQVYSLAALLPDHSDPHAVPLGLAAKPQSELVAERTVELVEQARQEGYAAGQRDALARINADQAALEARLERALPAIAEQAAQSAAQVVAAQAGDVAHAAWELARWALGRELTLDPNALTDAVTQALSDLDANVEVTVYAHPDALPVLQAWAAARTPKPYALVADTHLQVGEIRALSSTGTRVEATMTELGRRALARLVSTVAASDTVDDANGESLPAGAGGSR